MLRKEIVFVDKNGMDRPVFVYADTRHELLVNEINVVSMMKAQGYRQLNEEVQQTIC